MGVIGDDITFSRATPPNHDIKVAKWCKRCGNYDPAVVYGHSCRHGALGSCTTTRDVHSGEPYVNRPSHFVDATDLRAYANGQKPGGR